MPSDLKAANFKNYVSLFVDAIPSQLRMTNRILLERKFSMTRYGNFFRVHFQLQSIFNHERRILSNLHREISFKSAFEADLCPQNLPILPFEDVFSLNKNGSLPSLPICHQPPNSLLFS